MELIKSKFPSSFEKYDSQLIEKKVDSNFNRIFLIDNFNDRNGLVCWLLKGISKYFITNKSTYDYESELSKNTCIFVDDFSITSWKQAWNSNYPHITDVL